MARIAGIDLPQEKRVEVALTYIYGIGRTRAGQLLDQAGVSPDTRVKDLTTEEEAKIRAAVTGSPLKVEGELRREVVQNIKRLIDIRSYRGLRHRANLPVRGQRTRTNARTRRGKRRTIGGMKKVLSKK